VHGGDGFTPTGASIRQAVDAYVSRTIDPELFARVRPFALRVISPLEFASVHSAKNSMKEIVALCAWCVEVGIPLETRRVFDPDTIERFIEDGLSDASDAQRRKYRPDLRRLARRIEPKLQPAEPERQKRFVAKPPYSPTEVRGLLQLAEYQQTATRRNRLLALLYLGLGAGLQPGEYQHVHDDDVVTRSGIVHVTVGGRNARSVPVLEPYGRQLMRLSIRNAGEYLLGGIEDSDRRNSVERALRDLKGGAHLPQIELGRLRNTWLRHHISSTGLDVLLTAAGVVDSKSIFDLVRGLPRASDQRITQLLKGKA
jgi:integrase